MELNEVLPTVFEQEKVELWRKKSGENLRELRESIDVKQGAFAERMGVSRASLSAYELCSRTPDLSFINTVSLVTGCSVTYLLGQSSVMTDDYASLEEALGIDQKQAQQLTDLYWGTCAARELLADPNLLKAVQMCQFTGVFIAVKYAPERAAGAGVSEVAKGFGASCLLNHAAKAGRGGKGVGQFAREHGVKCE